MEKRNIQTIWRMLDTGSKLPRVSWDPKSHYGSFILVEAFGGQIKNGVMAQDQWSFLSSQTYNWNIST